MKKKLLINIFSILCLFVLIVPIFSSAQDDTVNNPSRNQGSQTSPSYRINIPSPLKICMPSTSPNCNIPGLLKVIISDVVIPIGGVVAALMIMYSGFLFVTAQGNETKLKTAKDTLLYACIGAAILLGAYVIAQAIQGTIEQITG